MNILHRMPRIVPLILLIGALAGSQMHGQNCFNVTGESIACSTATGAPGYTYTADLEVTGEIGIAYAEFTPLSPANITLTPSTKTINPTVASGDVIENLSFAITGSGSTAGATVKVLARLANGSSRTSLSCSDTLTFVLPDCNATCLTIVNERIECGQGDRGTIYTYTFDAINGGVLPISGAEMYYSVVSPANLSVSPSYSEIQGGFSSGDTLHDLSVTLEGGGAVGGQSVKLRLRVCNDGICCDDTVQITLPQCAPVSCFDLVRQEISCGAMENEYDYIVALKNTSNFNVGTLILYSQEGTFLTSQFNIGSLKPDQTVTRTTKLNVPKDYQGKEITITALFLGAEGDTCSSSFPLAVPECAPRSCFGIGSTSLVCVPTTSGSKAYEFGFVLHNESSKPVRWINLASQTPNIVVGQGWVDLGTTVEPGDSIPVGPTVIGGPGVKVDAQVMIGMSLAGSSSTDLVCSDSFAVVLPDCAPPPFEGCFGIEEDSVLCITSPTAPPAFLWTFAVWNTSNRKLDSLRIVSILSSKGGEVYPAPNTFTFAPGVEPGETATLGITLSGAGAIDGATLTILPEGFFAGEDAVCRSPHELELICEKEEEGGCLSITEGSFKTYPGSPDRVDWSFELTNESSSPIDRLLMTTLTSNVMVSEGGVVFDEPIAPGESKAVTATLTGGAPGQTIDVVIGMASASPTNVICTDTLQTSIPEIASSVAETEQLSGARLQGLYPNPARDRVTLRYVLERVAHSVTITVNDASGREVLPSMEGKGIAAGEHRFLLDTDGFPTGTYIVALNVDGRVESTTLNVVR